MTLLGEIKDGLAQVHNQLICSGYKSFFFGDKFWIRAAIFNCQFTDIIMLLPILLSGESPELVLEVGFRTSGYSLICQGFLLNFFGCFWFVHSDIKGFGFGGRKTLWGARQ